MELDQTNFIPAFYAGKSIFITGSTGFMGKVLIQKLLRTCPDVQEIFLLMRPKKGISIDDRLRQMIVLPLFDKLREENPSVFKKLIPVTGDVTEEGLGLPTIERRVLIERVSVVFHAAASVRFDDPLKKAIILNIRGTREVCILAASMKKLKVLLHVSTTYGNTDRPVIDEILYPPHANWRDTIKVAETLDDYTINAMTAKYLGNLPNTYTFTKQLAEHVINDYAGTIPSVIFRPSVVVSSLMDPIPGWLDNFNGPVGMLVGGGKGVLRTVHAKPDVVVDFIPVDIAINAILVSAWKRGITTITKDPSIAVYNCSSCGLKSLTTGNMIDMAFRITAEVPLERIIWRPGTTLHSYKSLYYLTFLIVHLLPALVIDGILKLSGAKPILLKLQRKIYAANFALAYFSTEEWIFKNGKLLSLLTAIPEANKSDFDFEFGKFDIPQYFRNSLIGSKIYLLKEDMNKLVEAKAHYDKMWWIDTLLRVWFGVFLIWASYTFGLFSYISSSITSAFDFSLTD